MRKLILSLAVFLGCQKETPHRASYFRPVENDPLPAFKPIVEKEETQTSFDVMKLPQKFHQKISCHVTTRLSLKDVIVSAAQKLNLSVRIDPSIQETCALKMNQEPFSNLIHILCQKENIHCRYINNVLSIEKDQVYTKTYPLACLNIERSAQNNMRISTDVFSYNSKKENDTSNSSISMNSKSNFWNELEKAFSMMLSKDAFSVHRQTGLVSIKGTRQQHLMVERYIKRLRSMLSAQVLIEAKVVEVNLYENYRSGVEWRNVARDLNIDASSISRHTEWRDAITLSAGAGSFNMVLRALDHFGETQTLASPSLRVLNNQSAVLKVAKNQVYFRLNYDKQFFTLRDQSSTSVSSELHTVPIGLVLLVQPSIDLETGKIMLFLRPTLSRLQDSVEDPAVRIMSEANAKPGDTKNTSSSVPIVDVREIDSVLCVQSGEMAVLGGLMDIRSQKDRQQIPGIGDIPLLGEAFQLNEKSHNVVELIILLRASIMQA